jgi:hypothetical protein
VATFAAYFDDSGTHDDATNVVCGGVAGDSQQMLRLESDWNAVLRMREYDLDYLHMKEMKSGKGKFAKFQHDLQLQRSLYERLHALTKIRTKTFGCVVLRSAFDRIDAEFQFRERSGSPFVLAASVSVYSLGKWMERYHYSDDLSIVVDKVHCWGELCSKLNELYGSTPNPGTLRTMPPLQAADHLAWEMHRANHQMVQKDFAPRSVRFRGAFDSLMRRFNADNWVTVYENDLRMLVDAWGVVRR